MTATALFVLGFTVVFLAQSVAVIGFSRAMLVNSETLMRVGGAVTIVMGLAMLGLIRPLQAERRLHVRPTGRIPGRAAAGRGVRARLDGVPGADAGRGAVAGQRHRLGRLGLARVSLVVFYCAGLGIPFLLLAFGFGWAAGAMGFLRRHTRTIQIVGAVGLIVLGMLMLTGVWGDLHRLAAGSVRRDRDACCDGPRRQPRSAAGHRRRTDGAPQGRPVEPARRARLGGCWPSAATPGAS